jgi:outer membrane lipoprotein LolB
MNRIRWLAILLIVSGTGCITPGAQQLTGEDRAAAVEAISDWKLQGRLALSNGRDGGSGQLTWQQSPQRADLQFIGALGRGSWRLRVIENLAELETAQIGLVQAPDVQTLLRQHLDWEIPVDSMRFWVLGRLNPEEPGSDNFDRRGRLLRLRQSGWLVEYDGWIDVTGVWLPRKVTASRDGNQVRILVKTWTVSG